MTWLCGSAFHLNTLAVLALKLRPSLRLPPHTSSARSSQRAGTGIGEHATPHLRRHRAFTSPFPTPKRNTTIRLSRRRPSRCVMTCRDAEMRWPIGIRATFGASLIIASAGKNDYTPSSNSYQWLQGARANHGDLSSSCTLLRRRRR